MKKLSFALTAAAVLLLASACASYDGEKIKEVTKATVHSLIINRQIDAGQFATIGGLISSAAQRDKLDLQPMVDRLQKDVYGDYTKNLPFAIVPEKDLLANGKYANEIAKETNNFSPFYLTPAGYSKAPLGRKNAIAMGEAFPEANATLGITIDFALKKTSGISIGGFSAGRAVIEAAVNFTILNSKGETLVQKRVVAQSKTSVGVVVGAFKADALPAMCNEAADKALESFNKWLISQQAKK